MHAEIEGQVFRSGQRAARGKDSLNDRVVRQVQEHDDAAHNVGALEGTAEIFRNVVFHAHRGKDDGKFGIVFDRRLLHDLNCQLVVLHAGAGENRQLLAADERRQRVNGGNAGIDIVSRIDTRNRIDRRAVDIPAAGRINLAHAVDRAAEAVKYTAQDLRRKRQLHRMAGQARTGIHHGYAARPLEHLDDHALTVDLNNPARAHAPIVEMQLHHFLVARVIHVIKDD